MADETPLRVEIDGRDVTGEYTEAEPLTQRLVYDVSVESDRAVHRELGPQGFMATFTDPSQYLRKLLADGQSHEFSFRAAGYRLTDRAVLRRECTDRGVLKLICCRPADEDSPKWVDDPDSGSQG